MSNVLEITDETFDSEVSNHKGPVLVYFHADWCGPCRQVTPYINNLSSLEENSDIKFVKMDIGQNVNVAANLNIQAIPSMMIKTSNEKLFTLRGAFRESEIQTWIDEVVHDKKDD